LEGTEPTTMCSLHSTRENDKLLGTDRLRQEMLQSGNTLVSPESYTIKLDLSFLDNYDFDSNSAGNTQSSGSNHDNMFELNDEPELPTTNYLLD
jgi:hypothetical protein